MNKHEFLKILRERANEQEKIINRVPFPSLFLYVSFWLGDHPWRILIPLAFIVTSLMHMSVGKPYDEFILKLFGKL